MLTLKAPIQLHIGQGLTGNFEAFGERIRGNYGLMSAKFTPKDLLFLLAAPPEVPEETGGMTTLVSQQTQVDARSVTLDVVNNVVNRILLDGTNQFTYQDQVYITSVLNRLGITNVEQFMAQVRQLRSENENTVHLTRLYRAELERTLREQAADESGRKRPTSETKEEEETPQTADPRVSMSMNILQRLETANLYETVHAFQRNWSVAESHLTRNEMRLAEQLRFSNVISMTEQRQQVFQYPQMHMQHHLNQFETGTILEIPRDEEAVLSQAAVAALVTAVDNTVTEVLNRPGLRQEQWVRLENALWQTAENTLSRFESYHNYHQMLPEAGAVERERLYHRELSQLEETYLRERQEQETIVQIDRKAEPVKMTPQSLREIWQGTQTPGQVLREFRTEQEPVSIFHPHQSSDEMLTTPSGSSPADREAAPEKLVEELTRIDQKNRTVIQNVQQELRQKRHSEAPPSPDVRRTMQDARRALESQDEVLREIYREREAAPTVHPSFTAEEEVLLKQADPVTRALYERVLLYQKDPEAALAQGLVRPGNLGALNAELRQAAEDAPMVLEHMETLREREELWHQSETVLEQFHRQPVAPRQQMAVQQSALHMVHKQLPSEITEELLEQLEERQTQRTVKVESSEEINRQNIHRTDMTQMEHKMVTQTSEDITELVNRTLAKQMRTISDQVYRQMEKRLMTERSRRGRF